MSRLKTLLKGIGIVGATTVGVGGCAAAVAYNQSPGFKREVAFWGKVGPVIGHYAWVNKYSKDAAERNAKFSELHKRYSGDILDLFTTLGGLYIKTGQYLSVRPEIVPEAYRSKLKLLQSEVPGRDYEDVKAIVESELGLLSETFASFDQDHIGAASIGQAHRARTLDDQDVVVKVMYPDVEWQFKVDLRCLKNVIDIGVWFDAVDGPSVQSSYKELEVQYLAELNYEEEVKNLKEISDSVKEAYKGRVAFPEALPHLSSKHVITMTFLAGPKLEDEMNRRLKRLGIETNTDIRSILNSKPNVNPKTKDTVEMVDAELTTDRSGNYSSAVGYYAVALLGPAQTLRLIRNCEWMYTSIATQLGYFSEIDATAIGFQGSEKKLIDTLLDVHGYEIFRTKLFNADPHPGNIILMEGDKLGLIDYGQCKRLDKTARRNIAACIVAVSEGHTDEEVATAMRNVGFKTKNDNASFYASFAQLLFGHIQVEMLDPAWHVALNKKDRIVTFPPEMIMVYRVAALLRGLALSLQYDISIGDAWCAHAKEALLELA
eukprot:m.70541 g.70541  ORF g.70541 m.70541 type:complete len:546 (-) comp24239_c0_seq2:163-1800(-)